MTVRSREMIAMPIRRRCVWGLLLILMLESWFDSANHHSSKAKVCPSLLREVEDVDIGRVKRRVSSQKQQRLIRTRMRLSVLGNQYWGQVVKHKAQVAAVTKKLILGEGIQNVGFREWGAVENSLIP